MRRDESHSAVSGAPIRRITPVRGGVTLLLVLVLTACGGDGGSGVQEDRRFATDPEPVPTELPATRTPIPTATHPVPTVPAFSASPEATPLPVQSQVTNIYALIGGEVLVLDLNTGQRRVIATSTDSNEIVLIAPLPDGTATGVITRPGSDSPRRDLTIVTAEGRTRSHWTDLASVLGPGQGQARGALAASWAPDAQRLAIVFPEGGGVVVHLGGVAQPLLGRGQAPAPMEIAWSPDGGAIAFTSRDLDDDSPYLAIGGTRVLPLDPVRIAGTGGQRPIHTISWQPDGEHLLAIQGSASRPDSIGGDLIEIDRRTLTAMFAVGGSRFGPGAQIVEAETAPDGQAWAIVTVAPGNSGGLEATVWSVVGHCTNATRLELGENPPVAGVIWTAHGLTVELHPSGELSAITFGVDGTPIAAATPEASPVFIQASPEVPPIIETATPTG